MPPRKKFLPFFILSFLSLATLIFLIIKFPPSYMIMIQTVAVPLIIPVFILLFLIPFGIVIFLGRNLLQALLIAIFLTTYLLLRFFGITHWLFALMLLLLFLFLELALYKTR